MQLFQIHQRRYHTDELIMFVHAYETRIFFPWVRADIMDVKSMTDAQLFEMQAAITAELSRRLAAAQTKAPLAEPAHTPAGEEAPKPDETPKEEAPPRCAHMRHNTARIFRSSLTCREQAMLCKSLIDFGY
jgi:hypothetical protein